MKPRGQEVRSQYVHLRIEPQALAILKLAADMAGESLSSWVRSVALREAGRALEAEHQPE